MLGVHVVVRFSLKPEPTPAHNTLAGRQPHWRGHRSPLRLAPPVQSSGPEPSRPLQCPRLDSGLGLRAALPPSPLPSSCTTWTDLSTIRCPPGRFLFHPQDAAALDLLGLGTLEALESRPALICCGTLSLRPSGGARGEGL